MRSSKKQIHLIALVLVLAFSGAVFGQDGNPSSGPLSTSGSAASRTIGEGQELKTEGIVVARNAETFSLREADGTQTVVLLTDKTNIKTVRKGLFRADRPSKASEIVRGLRLKVEGKGNGDGQLVARNIRFDEQDLRTAQALESRVDPVENLASSTEALARSNQTRVEGAENRLDQAEQNAQRLSGQVEEVSAVANSASNAATLAQTTANQAQSDAIIANNRINSLDDYEVFATVIVHFRPGSARLTAKAKAEIDEAATSVSDDLKGWIVAVRGYADSIGNRTKNRSLSDRRASAVINYLVTKHGLDPRRLVQPFGYGSLNPAAANNTREGRALNRRAEITVLINKGISSQASAQNK